MRYPKPRACFVERNRESFPFHRPFKPGAHPSEGERIYGAPQFRLSVIEIRERSPGRLEIGNDGQDLVGQLCAAGSPCETLQRSRRKIDVGECGDLMWQNHVFLSISRHFPFAND
jgi:hypothetical protein